MRAMRDAGMGEPAEETFLRAQARMRAESPFQEPVMAGNAAARGRPEPAPGEDTRSTPARVRQHSPWLSRLPHICRNFLDQLVDPAPARHDRGLRRGRPALLELFALLHLPVRPYVRREFGANI
jgi:hypothetical protein